MTEVKVQKGREFSVEVLKNQIGFWNIGAISGGRTYIDGATYNKEYGTTQQVEFPVAYGYRVRVTLGWDDTWTVSRVIVKNTKKGISEVIKGTIEGVYPEYIGEVAYQASCFRSNDAFGKVSA
jgi:hypothetical protein